MYKSTSLFRLVGDIKETEGYNMPLISKRWAQELVDFICSNLKWEKVEVVFSNRETKRTWGFFNHDAHRIVLNKKGENIGTLIHELSHHDEYTHNKHFKENQRKIISLIYKNIQQPIGTRK